MTGDRCVAILHADLDAFYASVEQRDDPRLAGRPVVVGGLGPRGVVAAASYEARRFGVRSAMPMGQARRACPDAAFVPPRFDRYGEVSQVVMDLFRAVTPLVEPIALDEAFLDVSGAPGARAAGDRMTAAARVAEQLRSDVRRTTGLSVSVGVATTKLVAKLASDAAKPDGMLVVAPEDALAFLHALPVERLWGVGPSTKRRLDRFGVVTVGDLAQVPEPSLVDALGRKAGAHLHALAWNRDDRAVEPHRELKSVGHEETFGTDRRDRSGLEREVRRMADRVGERLRRAGRRGRTVQLKARYADFRTVTRSRTLAHATDVADEIGAVAVALLRELPLGDGLRLLGVAVQQLGADGGYQARLFEDAGAPAASGGSGGRRGDWRAVEQALDEVRERFGAGAAGVGRDQAGGR